MTPTPPETGPGKDGGELFWEEILDGGGNGTGAFEIFDPSRNGGPSDDPEPLIVANVWSRADAKRFTEAVNQFDSLKRKEVALARLIEAAEKNRNFFEGQLRDWPSFKTMREFLAALNEAKGEEGL